MPDLIPAIFEPVSIRQLRLEILEAQAFLARAARRTARLIADLPVPSWGQEAKRRRCVLPLGPDRPARIHACHQEHSFAEVLNQCAHLERLADTLAWAGRQMDFRGWEVRSCHPTTSSSQKVQRDNDLVLAPAGAPDDPGAAAYFEVSDVTGKRDGNRKQDKSLRALGVLAHAGKAYPLAPEWPSGRLFIATSETLGKQMQGQRKKLIQQGAFHYQTWRPEDDSTTWILEVVRGRAVCREECP